VRPYPSASDGVKITTVSLASAAGAAARGSLNRDHYFQRWRRLGNKQQQLGCACRGYNDDRGQDDRRSLLHSALRRHAERNLDRSRGPRSDAPAAQPGARHAGASARTAASTSAVSVLLRVGALLALLALVLPAAASARSRPSLSASSAILIEPSSGEIIYARNPYTHHEIASTTKMMTALLLLERRSLAHRIRVVNFTPGPAESTAGLSPGERLTSADMLRALLLASANEAAISIAADVGGSQKGFVRMMNARAKRAGLRSTHFSNPDGLDGRQNYSTARDLASLGILLRQNSFARRTIDRPKATLRSGSHKRVVYNRNTLIGSVPWMNGIKTGHTSSAGYLLVGGATRDGAELISVVMGEPSEAARNADTLKLMRYGFGRYQSVQAVRKGQRFATLPVEGRDDKVQLITSRSADLVMRRGERPTTIVSGLPATLTGPLAKGTRIGDVIVLRRGKSVDRVPLVAASAVAAPSLLAAGGSWLGPLAGGLAVFTLILFSATLIRKRRRQRRPERVQREPA